MHRKSRRNWHGTSTPCESFAACLRQGASNVKYMKYCISICLFITLCYASLAQGNKRLPEIDISKIDSIHYKQIDDTVLLEYEIPAYYSLDAKLKSNGFIFNNSKISEKSYNPYIVTDIRALIKLKNKFKSFGIDSSTIWFIVEKISFLNTPLDSIDTNKIKTLDWGRYVKVHLHAILVDLGYQSQIIPRIGHGGGSNRNKIAFLHCYMLYKIINFEQLK